MASLTQVLLLVIIYSFGFNQTGVPRSVPSGDTRNAGLTIQVTDPSTAVLTDALVVVHLQPGSAEPGAEPDESHRNDLTHLALNDFTATFHADLQPGTYDVFISRPGFHPNCQTIYLAAGESMTLAVKMRAALPHKTPLG
jgi:hypothetical protein